MRIAVAATPSVALPTLNWLRRSSHDLGLIITRPDKQAGRGRKISQSVVGDWANEFAIELIKPNHPSEMVNSLADFELLIAIGYGVILPPEVLTVPKYGWINLHFSLLPKYRGAAPVQRAIENGELVTGVTVFALDDGMDTGPIYAQRELKIEHSWRSVELLDHLAQLGPALIEQSIESIESGVKPIEQSGPFSLAPKITKAEAKIDWDQSSGVILNKIRAFSLQPGPWTSWRNENFGILRAQGSEFVSATKPGTICVRGRRAYVSAGQGCEVEILSVLPAGKKEMSAPTWANGARIQSGDFFG